MANELLDKLYELHCIDSPELQPKITLIKAIHGLVNLGFMGLSTADSEVLNSFCSIIC